MSRPPRTLALSAVSLAAALAVAAGTVPADAKHGAAARPATTTPRVIAALADDVRPAPAPAPASTPAATPTPAASASPEPEAEASRNWSGVASWYGARFAGRPTASGAPFDPDALTAAHLTLPFGTQVRVTSTRTGRSVVVEINDRGPHVAGREIDLSRAAADIIGLRAHGVGPVRLAIVG